MKLQCVSYMPIYQWICHNELYKQMKYFCKLFFEILAENLIILAEKKKKKKHSKE